MTIEDEVQLHAKAFLEAFAERNDLDYALEVTRKRGAIFLISIRALMTAWGLRLRLAADFVEFSRTWRDRGNGSYSFAEDLTADYPSLNAHYLEAFIRDFRADRNLEACLQKLLQRGATNVEAVPIVKTALGLNATQAISLMDGVERWHH